MIFNISAKRLLNFSSFILRYSSKKSVAFLFGEFVTILAFAKCNKSKLRRKFNMKRNNKALFITHAAIIAAIYVVLTYLASILGLSNGAIQIRFSEALTILPFFTSAAVPGLFIGCIIANILSGAVIWDIIFGSLATLIGAIGTYLLRKKTKWLAPVPPIIANTIIVPFVLVYACGVPDGLPFLMLTVGIGEIISCGVFGMILLKCLERYRNHIFRV